MITFSMLLCKYSIIINTVNIITYFSINSNYFKYLFSSLFTMLFSFSIWFRASRLQRREGHRFKSYNSHS